MSQSPQWQLLMLLLSIQQSKTQTIFIKCYKWQRKDIERYVRSWNQQIFHTLSCSCDRIVFNFTVLVDSEGTWVVLHKCFEKFNPFSLWEKKRSSCLTPLCHFLSDDSVLSQYKLDFHHFIISLETTLWFFYFFHFEPLSGRNFPSFKEVVLKIDTTWFLLLQKHTTVICKRKYSSISS